jgi:hypothetical protein
MFPKRKIYPGDLPIRDIDPKEIGVNLTFAKVWDAMSNDAENQEERDYLERLAGRARREVEEARQKGRGVQQK